MTEIEGLRERAKKEWESWWKKTYPRTVVFMPHPNALAFAAYFVALIQQETREECAKIAEKMLNGKGIAAAIRDLQREENKNGSF
jgi:hypothetical protein